MVRFFLPFWHKDFDLRLLWERISLLQRAVRWHINYPALLTLLRFLPSQQERSIFASVSDHLILAASKFQVVLYVGREWTWSQNGKMGLATYGKTCTGCPNTISSSADDSCFIDITTAYQAISRISLDVFLCIAISPYLESIYATKLLSAQLKEG